MTPPPHLPSPLANSYATLLKPFSPVGPRQPSGIAQCFKDMSTCRTGSLLNCRHVGAAHPLTFPAQAKLNCCQSPRLRSRPEVLIELALNSIPRPMFVIRFGFSILFLFYVIVFLLPLVLLYIRWVWRLLRPFNTAFMTGQCLCNNRPGCSLGSDFVMIPPFTAGFFV